MLEEEVYMKAPLGFEAKGDPDKICKLKKTL